MTHSEKSTIDSVRLIAYRTLLAIWRGEGPLGSKLIAGDDQLDVEVIARVMRLVRETLRYEDLLSKHIRKFINKNPKKQLRALLILASYEKIFQNAKDYAVVNSYVAIAKHHRETRNSAGFINAILRKITCERFEVTEQDLGQNESFGTELRAHLETYYSKDRLDEIARAQSEEPAIDLRIKDGDLEYWAERFQGQCFTKHNLIRIPREVQISQLEGFQDGAWWVQDLAATIAVDYFSALNGKRALDLCAAPGGKTLQLLVKGATVTSVEKSKPRSRRIYENLSRTKLKAEVLVMDALDYNDEIGFDAILLDAPCSATGTFRRHPDLKYGNPLERMQALQELQATLLRHAFTLLKPGAELIYVTCSLLKEEGEDQINAFLASEAQAQLIPLDAGQFGLGSEFTPFLRTFPIISPNAPNMDGFFIAKLTKRP